MLVVLVSIVQSRAALFASPAPELTPLFRFWCVSGLWAGLVSCWTLSPAVASPAAAQTRPQPSNLRSIYLPVSRAAVCFHTRNRIVINSNPRMSPPPTLLKLSLLSNYFSCMSKGSVILFTDLPSSGDGVKTKTQQELSTNWSNIHENEEKTVLSYGDVMQLLSQRP